MPQAYVDPFQQVTGNSDIAANVDGATASTISMPPVDEQVAAGDNTNIQPRGGAMPDQVYPVDPSAFRIPGM